MIAWVAKKLLGVVAEPIIGWFKHKQEMKTIKRQTEMQIVLKKQELLNTQATADIEWDKIMARASEKSWKDEFWTILLAIPLVPVFMGGDAALAIQEGFEVLKGLPLWYQAALGVAIGAAFGRNELAKFIGVAKH